MYDVGKKMYERAVKGFSVKHLNELFYKTITEDVLKGSFDESKADMTI